MSDKRSYFTLLSGIVLVALSVSLVIVIGYAQALKSYKQQTSEVVLAQAEAVKIGIEQVLGSGVPIYDIANLETVLKPIVSVNDAVTNIRIVADEKPLYQYNDASIGTFLQIPLNNKFTEVGRLEIVINDSVIEQSVRGEFVSLVAICIALVLLFLWSLLRNSDPNQYVKRFSLVFAAVTLAVIFVVVSLYRTGLEGKAASMANILNQRMAPVLNSDISAHRVSGLDELLNTYRVSNDEVSSILVRQNGAIIASSSSEGGLTTMNDFSDYQYSVGGGNQVEISFSAAKLVSNLAKIVKSFVILFIGCALICFVFARILHTPERQAPSDTVLERLKPLFLATVLMESIMAPVLPPYLESVVASSGGEMALSSYIFTVYFVGFALILLPASRLIERYAIRNVLNIGVILSVLSSLLLAYTDMVMAVFAARFVAGIGQAIIFISVQGYILRFSNKNNKTQAAAIIVFCFNAAFIAGASIGALLVDYIGIQGIFLLSACSGVVVLAFATLLPRMASLHSSKQSFLSQLNLTLVHSAQLLRQRAFFRTILFVGIPTKMMLTGVVTYAVPILLNNQGVSKESIGQVLMAYACAVLLTSGKAAKRIDVRQNYKMALTAGSVVSVLSLGLLGYAVTFESSTVVVNMTMVAMLVMGISHGFINAPIISHVVSVAKADSDTTIASTYRFLERLGHVLGAIVVAMLINMLGAEMAFYALAGFFVIATLVMYIWEKDANVEVTQ